MYINATDEIEKKWESNRRRAVRLTAEIRKSGEAAVVHKKGATHSKSLKFLRLESLGRKKSILPLVH